MIADRAPPSTHHAANQLVGWEQEKAFGFPTVHQVILQILDWSHKDNVFISHPANLRSFSFPLTCLSYSAVS